MVDDPIALFNGIRILVQTIPLISVEWIISCVVMKYLLPVGNMWSAEKEGPTLEESRVEFCNSYLSSHIKCSSTMSLKIKNENWQKNGESKYCHPKKKIQLCGQREQ